MPQQVVATTAIDPEIMTAIVVAETEAEVAVVVAIRLLQVLVHRPNQSTNRQRSNKLSKQPSLLGPQKRSEAAKNLEVGLEPKESVCLQQQ